MILIWTKTAWNEYLYWQQYDKNILKKMNALIKDIERNPFEGIGKPEPLKFEFSGKWSRRIDAEHRLVYTVESNGDIIIYQCRYHYSLINEQKNFKQYKKSYSEQIELV